jgi:hypothetical protein
MQKAKKREIEHIDWKCGKEEENDHTGRDTLF